jgi:hypothetical protein
MLLGQRAVSVRRKALARLNFAMPPCKSGITEENIVKRMVELDASLSILKDDLEIVHPDIRAAEEVQTSVALIYATYKDFHDTLDQADPESESMGEDFKKFKFFIKFFKDHGIECPREEELMDMYERMELKGEALVELKSAMDTWDEHEIEAACARVRHLQQKHGTFGLPELLAAEERQKMLKVELKQMAALQKALTDFVHDVMPKKVGLDNFVASMEAARLSVTGMVENYRAQHTDVSAALMLIMNNSGDLMELGAVLHSLARPRIVELTGTALPATLEQCAALLLELAPAYGKYVTVQQALVTRMISSAHERADVAFYFGDITAVL